MPWLVNGRGWKFHGRTIGVILEYGQFCNWGNSGIGAILELPLLENFCDIAVSRLIDVPIGVLAA